MDSEAEADVLLLGDSNAGKTVFLSVLIKRLNTRTNALAADVEQLLRHNDQPYVLDLRHPKRPTLRLNFYDTASPSSYTLLRPSFIILCFDTRDRASFGSIKTQWKHQVEMHFNFNENLPIMLLGLKRDEMVDESEGVEERSDIVLAQEALNVAQEMRLDRYAECSARSGQTLAQACEDVIQMAVKSVGGRDEKHYCLLM